MEICDEMKLLREIYVDQSLRKEDIWPAMWRKPQATELERGGIASFSRSRTSLANEAKIFAGKCEVSRRNAENKWYKVDSFR